METIETLDNRPFKHLIATIGALPTSFIDSMSYYEMLAWLCDYIGNKVTPAVNENAEALKELQEYVANYFDNLDVQEEIDNKLDEMAADGELAAIISQYLNSTAIFGFDTVADMIVSDNLIDGSFARTTGFATKNDGNGAFYKIRTITISDVVDNNFIIAMTSGENLIAEKIVANNDKHSVLNYGADPTGTNDSAAAINACIQANKGGTISLAEGTYKVQSAINLPFADAEKVNINGNGAKIITTATIDSLFVGGADRANVSDRNNVGFISYIKDLNIDCSTGSVTNAFYNMQGFKDWHIINCTTYRTTNGVKIGDSNNSPADILIDGCILYGNGSEYGKGIISNATDNYVTNTRIYGYTVGIEVGTNSAMVVDNSHILLRWHDQTNSNFNPYPIDGADFLYYYPLTVGVDIKGGFRSTNLYVDSMCTMAKVDTTYEVSFINAKCANSRTGVEQHGIDVANRDPKLTISDSLFQYRDGEGKSATGLRCTHTTPTFNVYAQIALSNIDFIGVANLTNPFDLLLAGYPSKLVNNKSMTANTWYIIGVVGNFVSGDSGSIILNIDSWDYLFRMSSGAIQQFIADTNAATNYTVGTFVENNCLIICAKTTTTGNHRLNFRLGNTANPTFAIYPIKGDSIAASSRLLSDYTATVPSLTKQLFSNLGISQAT